MEKWFISSDEKIAIFSYFRGTLANNWLERDIIPRSIFCAVLSTKYAPLHNTPQPDR